MVGGKCKRRPPGAGLVGYVHKLIRNESVRKLAGGAKIAPRRPLGSGSPEGTERSLGTALGDHGQGDSNDREQG
jgi:hypothetical protein